MKIRYLTLITTLAFLGFSVSAMAHDCSRHLNNPNHKHCDVDPPSGGAIVYTAELTMGAFVFNTDPGLDSVVVVTPNSMANTFSSKEDLDMVRIDPLVDEEAEATWNHVFNTCVELLTPDSVSDFLVGEDDWSIQKAGGVRVVFYDVRLTGAAVLLGDAEVTVQLIGNVFDFTNNPFLPVPELGTGKIATSEFFLDQAAIYGRTAKGVHPRSGCQPQGSGSFDVFDLEYFNGSFLVPFPSTLKITATRQ
jgi:hypothetical protein